MFSLLITQIYGFIISYPINFSRVVITISQGLGNYTLADTDLFYAVHYHNKYYICYITVFGRLYYIASLGSMSAVSLGGAKRIALHKINALFDQDVTRWHSGGRSRGRPF